MTRNRSIPESAALLGIKPSTLAKWRALGIGPRWVKLGTRCLYPEDALEEFVRKQTQPQKVA